MKDQQQSSPLTRLRICLEFFRCPHLFVLLLLSAALFLGVGWKLYSIDHILKTSNGYAGIVSLELAFTPRRADGILNAWAAASHAECARGTARGPLTDCAMSSLYWDFLFILAYVLFLMLLFATVLCYLQLPFKDYRRAFAAIPLAGLLDVSEDVALVAVLNHAGWFPVLLASVAAMLKFLLLGGVLIALLSLGAYWLFSRAWQSNAESAPAWIKSLEQVVENEGRYLRGRRELAGLKDDPRFGDAPIGMALSGGGIRSATISLGVIQKLMESDFFKRVDYLATVSGGGYIGTALSSLLASRGHVGFDARPFEFDERDRPHFESEGVAAPFAESQKRPLAEYLRWLNGSDVVAHLRAFGEFLVRRHRVLNRDLLRTIGHLLSGVTSMLLLFAIMIFLIASVLLVLMFLNGGPALLVSVGGLSTYLSGMWQASGRDGIAINLFLGAVSPLLLSSVASYTLVRTPDAWFRRDGDSPEEARQYRLLWVVGGALFVSGFVLNPLLLHPAGDAVPSLLLPPLFFLGAVLSTAVTYVLMLVAALDRSYFRSGRKHRSYLGALLGLNLYLLAIASGVMSIPYVIGLLGEQGSVGGAATAGAGGGLTAVVLAWWRKRKTDAVIERMKSGWQRSTVFLHKLVLGVAVAVFVVAMLLLAVIVVIDVLAWLGHAPITLTGLLWCVGGFGVLFLVSGYFADFNKLSLHYFYRDRLVEAYMRTEARPRDSYGREQELKRDHGGMRVTQLQGRRGDGSQVRLADGESFVHYQVESRGELDRFKFWSPPKVTGQRFAGAVTPAPYHLYSTCVNLLTDRDMRFRSRKSDIFIFSRFYCGSSVTGYMDSGVYRMGNTKVARAMSISGAAVDSAVGGDSFFAQSFATTLFNIRLGQWMENPAFRGGKYACWQENWVFWPKYLLMEALGMSDSRRRLVHLSDGGHTGDNLALVPLLQRRCRLIVVVDAEHDPDYAFSSLINAIRYAEVDYGARIDIDLDGFLPDTQGLVPKHFVSGKIRYPENDHFAASEGMLVVLKSSVTAGDETQIHKFRQIQPNFPQQTTGDQFFSEAQFEAYRKLGKAMARDLLIEHPELAQGDLNVAD